MKMIGKKLGLLVLMVGFLSFTSKAQDEGGDTPGFRFGFVTSPGLSYLQVNTRDQDRDGVGFSFAYGIHSEFRITDNISIATGLTQSNYRAGVTYGDGVNFIYQGTEAGVTLPPDTSAITSRDYIFKMIELPLKLKLKTPEIGYMTYFLEAGVNANINYSAESAKNTILDGGVSSELANELERIDANDVTNWYRAGTILTVGFEYNFIGRTSLLCSINWSDSFTNILRDNSIEDTRLFYESSGQVLQQAASLDYVGMTVGILF